MRFKLYGDRHKEPMQGLKIDQKSHEREAFPRKRQSEDGRLKASI